MPTQIIRAFNKKVTVTVEMEDGVNLGLSGSVGEANEILLKFTGLKNYDNFPFAVIPNVPAS